MKRSVRKIDIAAAEIFNAKSEASEKSGGFLPEQKVVVVKEEILPAGEREIAQANDPHSPLRGKKYDDRAHHGHDGSYSGHKRAGKIGARRP
jgi:hypothetical protein